MSPFVQGTPALATKMSRRLLNSWIWDVIAFSTVSAFVTLTWYALPMLVRLMQEVFDQLTLDIEVLLNLLRPVVRFFIAVVPYGNISTKFSETPCHSQSNASVSPRDDGCLAFQGKERHDPF